MRYHIGMIPDGNRRWAEARGLEPWDGHKIGAEKGRLFLEWALSLDEVSEVTVYVLSEENFGRTPQELEKLYEIYEDQLKKLIDSDRVHADKVRVNIISTNAKPIPGSTISLMKKIDRETKDYENKVLNVLIGYTGQSEILNAVSSLRNRVKNLLFGLSEKDLNNSLMVKTPCDLIIRTGTESGREARSGFLLWQTAYSEYYHINKSFPDITEEDLDKAWDYFKNIRRRKGL